MKTFDKVETSKPTISKRKSFDVFVVVRHTRSRDVRVEMIDDTGPASREHAMSVAEEIANHAAYDYGQGSASVFKGKLTLNAECEMP